MTSWKPILAFWAAWFSVRELVGQMTGVQLVSCDLAMENYDLGGLACPLL